MEELKYARTDMGIGKIIGEEEIDFQQQGKCPIRYREIIKTSNNIIDLIEDEDYIGRSKVESIEWHGNNEKYIRTENGNNYDCWDINEILKDGIVTKEQFLSMEYKVVNNV